MNSYISHYEIYIQPFFCRGSILQKYMEQLIGKPAYSVQNFHSKYYEQILKWVSELSGWANVPEIE